VLLQQIIQKQLTAWQSRSISRVARMDCKEKTKIKKVMRRRSNTYAAQATRKRASYLLGHQTSSSLNSSQFSIAFRRWRVWSVNSVAVLHGFHNFINTNNNSQLSGDGQDVDTGQELAFKKYEKVVVEESLQSNCSQLFVYQIFCCPFCRVDLEMGTRR